MRLALVEEPKLVTDDAIGMQQGLKPLTINTLLFQGSDYTFYDSFSLRAVRRDELLFQTVASDHGSDASVGKDQAIVRSQQEGLLHSAQGSKSRNRGLLQSRFSRSGLARTRQIPAQKLSGVAVVNQSQGHPSIPTRPDSAEARGPALIRRDCHRRQCLNSRPKAIRSLLHLPTPDLEEPPKGGLVHVQKAGHSSVAIRAVLLDQCLNGSFKPFLHLRSALGWLIIN